MRKPLIAGNWKMNKTPSEAGELARILKDKLEGESSPDIVLCPPFTALDVVARAIQRSHLSLGAQNLY